MSDNIEVAIINQLSDNYSYIIYSTKIKKALIVDPAESKPLINYLIEKDLSLQGILITHHHSDHTSGIKGLLDFKSVNVYSPSLKISKTSKLIKDMDKIDFNFIDFQSYWKLLATLLITLFFIIQKISYYFQVIHCFLLDVVVSLKEVLNKCLNHYSF